MANPLGIFFSRLAPEDKQFIKKIGISLVVLFILSSVGLYFFGYIEKDVIEQAAHMGIFDQKDTLAFELPPAPIIPTIPEEAGEAKETEETEKIGETEEKSENLAESDVYLPSLPSTEPSTQISIQGIAGMFLENPKLAAQLGHLLLEAGYPAEAVYILQNGIQMNSAPISVLVDLVYGHFYSKNYETALNELDTALNKYPGNADLLTAKAAISGQYPDTSQRNKAENMFKSILKKNPESAEANYQYGRYIMQRGDFKKSQEYLEKAVKIEPYNPRYVARLGMAEFYLKRDANAEVLYKKSLKINPYDYNTWFNLGELYLSMANESGLISEVRQKTHKALEAYSRTIEIDSLHAEANYRIGLILNGNGQHKEAIRHLNIALAKMPKDIPIMQQLSSAYIKINDTLKSVSYLDTILQIDPFNKIAASEFKRLRK